MIATVRDAATFTAAFDVSRETTARIGIHLDLLRRWTSRINLVAASTLDDAWSRHVADSAQLWALRPATARIWGDLASGAGFPGLVIAAMARELDRSVQVHLVESDHRKAAFLATVAREADLPAEVHVGRIETLRPLQADVLSARALAALDGLLGMAEKHRKASGIGLFPKGETVHKEVADAERRWHFEYRIHPSRTDPRGAVVEVGAIERV